MHNPLETPRGLLAFTEKAELPAYVANCIIEPEDLQKRSSVGFADREARRLPLGNSAETFISACEYAAAPDDYPEDALSRIKTAATVFGVFEDVRNAIEIVSGAREDEISKVAATLPDTSRKYACVIPDLAEHPVALFDITDAELTKEALAEFDKCAGSDRLPWTVLREAATNLKRAAVEFDLPVPVSVRRWGVTLDKGDLETVQKVAGARKSVVRTPEYHEAMDVCLKAAAAAQDENQLLDILNDMFRIDETCNVKYAFGADAWEPAFQPSPLEIVFCGTDQDAMSKLASSYCMIAEELVPVAALLGTDDDRLNRLLDANDADRVLLAKAAAVRDGREASRILREIPSGTQIKLLAEVLRGSE